MPVNVAPEAFRAALARLHPSEAGRMVAVVLMCRIANKVIRLHRPQIARMSVAERRPLIDGSPPAHYAEDMARRFSADEAGALQRRFAELNRRLEADREASHRPHQEIRTLRCGGAGGDDVPIVKVELVLYCCVLVS